MYRRVFRSMAPLTSGSAIRAVENSQLTLTRSSTTWSPLENAVRRRSGITYSQWHHMRTSANCERASLSRHSHGHCQTTVSLTGSKTSEEVREVFGKYHRLLEAGEFNPESVVDFSLLLCSAVYSSLRRLPWLHSENHIISYMQILMNGRTTELLTEPLYSCAYFQSIYSHILHSVTEIPGEDCPSVLLSLVYSGLEQTDALAIRLLNRCYDIIPELSIPQLRDSAHVLQSLGNRDFVFAEKLVSRLDDLLSQGPDSAPFEIRDLCVSSPVLAVYMSQELLEKCIAAMLQKAQEQFSVLDVATIGCCLRFSRKMIFRGDRENLEKLSVLAKAALENLTDYDRVQSHQVAEVCHNAKRLGCYSGKIVDRMQEHSLRMLRTSGSSLHIREITNLLFAFGRDISSDVKQEICELLMKNMEDADVLTLSNIADNLLELDVTDPRVIALFQRKVLENIDNIAQYITRLVKVLRLLRDRLEYDSAFNLEIFETLLRLLERRQGYDPTFVVVMTQFLLPNVRTIMPAILMDCLLKTIPRCNLSLMLLILNGLEKMKGPWSRALHLQVLEIRSLIQQNIGEQVEKAAHAGQLAELIKGLHVKSQIKDFFLLDRMMDHYPRLTKSLSRNDYLKTVQVFKRLSHPYYHPEVFEDLISFAKDNCSNITFYGILDLANILAHSGYRPEQFDSFSAFMVQVLEDMVKAENYIGQISLSHYLALMQIFPDHVLARIFTFDYLEEVDTIIEADPERWSYLKALMMQLNRSMILECPHLDVPWFHDQFCRERAEISEMKARDFQRNLGFLDEVEGAVREVMRGMDCVGQNVYSPYFHPIDFEVVFDAKGEAISTAALNRLNPDKLGFSRVAVKLVGNQQLCANSHRRRGIYMRDRRHLEILGYRVEEITRYDWNSMAMSDWTSKVKYVRSKIFPTSGREPRDAASSEAAAKTSTMHPYWK